MSFTLIKKNPTAGEVTSSLTSESGGLHFDGATGSYVDCTDTAVMDGATKMSIELVASTSATAIGLLISKSYSAHCFKVRFDAAGTLSAWVNNGSSTANPTTAGTYNDGKPHHVVVTWDNATVKIYVDGKQDGSAALAGGSIPNTTDKLAIGAEVDSGSSNTNNFNGTISRARIYNRVIDAKKLFENQNLEFSEQWGSQTDLVNANSSGSGTAWTGASSSTAPTGWSPAGSPRTYTIDSSSGSGSEPALKIEAGAANVGIKWGSAATLGKKYRVTFSYKCGDADTVMAYRLTDAGSFVNLANSTSWSHNNVVEFIGDGVTGGLMFRVNTSGKLGHFDNIKLEAVGCVSSYELQTANPTQSLMVQDSSGAADGTCSASGVSQIQPLTQLNSKAISVSNATARTPSDGAIVADRLGIGTVSSFTDSQAAIVGGDNVGLALQSTHSGKTSRVRFFDNSGNQDATIGFDNSTSNLFMGTGTNAHLQIDSSGNVTQVSVNSGGDVTAFQLRNGAAATSTSTSLRFVNSTVATATHGGAELTSIRNANDGGSLVFKTAADTSTTLTERMTIDSAGAVQILSDGASNSPAHLSLWAKDTSIAGGDEIGTLLGQGSDNATSPPLTGAKINFVADHTWDGQASNYQSTRMEFYTQDNSGSNTLTDPRMTIGSAGIVQIGAASGATHPKLQLVPGTSSGDSMIQFRNTANDGTIAQIKAMQTSGTVDGLAIGTAESEHLKIDSTGLATFTGEITCTGLTISNQTNTATGTRASSKFDHYEEGSWTPVLKKGSTTHTGVTVYGKYTRVGNLVWISFYIYKDAGGTESATGTWNVSGLPFSIVENGTAGYQQIPSGYFRLNGTDYINSTPHRWQANDTTAITMYGNQRNTDWASGAMEFQGTGVLQVG